MDIRRGLSSAIQIFTLFIIDVVLNTLLLMRDDVMSTIHAACPFEWCLFLTITVASGRPFFIFH